MKVHRQFDGGGFWRRLSYAAAAGALALMLAGCGGGSGGGTAATSTGSAAGGSSSGSSASQTVTPPSGAVVDASTLASADFAALAPSGAVSSVTIHSPPVVAFQVTDASGHGIKGLGFTSKKSTDLVPNLQNMSFTLAKLVPGTNGSPSKWVSYLVLNPATTTTADAPRRPSWETFGNLVDNGDGTYQYTFYTDITKIKDFIAAQTYTAPNAAADLGDLTYDPTLLHRLVIRVGGYARGTSTNTADGTDSGVTGVTMGSPTNIVFDFYPATGQVVQANDPNQREIVKTAKCFECHQKFAFHGTNMQDTRFCATCHTDQRRYGRVEATATATGFDSTKGTYLVMGRAVGDLPNHIHKIHMGEKLTKTGYNYANVLYNETTYPQPITNCVKCHDGTAGAANQTPQGDNWKNVPSRLACGACHDGIDFSTGKGLTLADASAGLSTSPYGHIGGIQTDDSKCALCHSAAAIPVYHITVDPTGASGYGGYPLNTAKDTPTVGYNAFQGPTIPVASQLNQPAGLYKFAYEIKQVTVSGAAGAKKASVVYRVLKDGQPVTFNATGYLISGVDGAPGIAIAYAVPQDGIASPADWNFVNSLFGGTPITDFRDGKYGNSQTGPDANSYYTATLGITIPDNATMVTGAVGLYYNGFVQLNHPDYPKGIRLRETKFVMKTADGYTPRRSLVDADKCNKCHGQLGISPTFHAGARNNAEGCAFCHSANRATGHVGPTNNFGGGWSASIKNAVHSIHASAKRQQAFTWLAGPSNPNGYKDVTYPGVLKNCETCHVSGSYDFSGSANSAALPNLLWTTDANGDMTNNATTNPTGITPIGLNPWVTTLGDGQVNYTTDNLVTSPIASACFGCHDSSLAVQHMQSNGGTLLKRFSSVSSLAAGAPRPMVSAAGIGDTTAMTFTKSEQCMLCHATGKVADIKAMHAK